MEKLTVRQARMVADISKKEMAKALGLSVSGYTDKENGRRKFYFKEAVIFSELVGIPAENILFY